MPCSLATKNQTFVTKEDTHSLLGYRDLYTAAAVYSGSCKWVHRANTEIVSSTKNSWLVPRGKTDELPRLPPLGFCDGQGWETSSCCTVRFGIMESSKPGICLRRKKNKGATGHEIHQNSYIENFRQIE